MGIFTKTQTDDEQATDQVAEVAEVTEEAAPAEAPVTETAAADAPSEALAITLDQLVNLAIENEASDVHFGEDAKIALRVGGKIMFIENVEVISKEIAEKMVFEMLQSEEERKRFEGLRELDFSYAHKSGVNFRVNAFYQQGKLAANMRMISKNLPSIDDLGVPEEIKKLLTVREGLILVCGPAGSGKSTTTQAMLEYVNENFVKHVITIENPIEYLFESKQSIFTQREVGKDTLSVKSALRSATRQDPNIIVVSEIGDFETLDEILTLVETGHLVIASFTTKDSKQTLERMMSLFPDSERSIGAQRISDSLLAILSQDLAQRTDQVGRIAVYEFMLMNRAIRDALGRLQFNQIRTMIQSGAGEGMITLDAYAYQLAEQGVIDQVAAQEFAQEEERVAA